MIKFCIHTIEFDCTILNDFLIRVMTPKKRENIQIYNDLFICSFARLIGEVKIYMLPS